MSRPCSICISDDRAAIDEALVTGKESQPEIAERFGTSTSALYRHRTHVTEKVAEAQAVNRTALLADGATLLDRLRWLLSEADRLKAAAEKAKDYRTALQGLREIMRVLEFVADVERADREASQIDALAEWKSLPYQEKRIRVAEMKLLVCDLEEEAEAEAAAAGARPPAMARVGGGYERNQAMNGTNMTEAD
jgi:transposase-like protein